MPNKTEQPTNPYANKPALEQLGLLVADLEQVVAGSQAFAQKLAAAGAPHGLKTQHKAFWQHSYFEIQVFTHHLIELVKALSLSGAIKKSRKVSSKIEDKLSFLEAYNGWGYVKKGINSPYLWSGTNHYTSGKYVRDGVFDPRAVSKQLGAVCMLKELEKCQ
jgi:hypothetical protein